MIIKEENEKPACVKQEHYDRFLIRDGWMKKDALKYDATPPKYNQNNGQFIDINQDGNIDYVTAFSGKNMYAIPYSQIAIWFGTGNGYEFELELMNIRAGTISIKSISDFNTDGHLDLQIFDKGMTGGNRAATEYRGGGTYIFLNNGTAGFMLQE